MSCEKYVVDGVVPPQGHRLHSPTVPVATPSPTVPSAPMFAGQGEVLEAVVVGHAGPPAPPAPGLDRASRARHLAGMGLPLGLQEAFLESAEQFGARFWVVDNSGSMGAQDGKRVVAHGDKIGVVTSSRWEELGDGIAWHGALAARLRAPTEFVLLNPPVGAPQRVVVGLGDEAADLAALRAVQGSAPTGRTPLCAAVRGVVASIRAAEPALRAAHRRALVVIASDGEPSDGDVLAALAPLAHLPCWVVVRLCTEEDHVVDFWNRIDEDLELNMDVLDDLCGEAAEVAPHAPWLTYGAELHRLREWGCQRKVFDLLDERKLHVNEVAAVAALVLGGAAADLPHPELDWKAFVSGLDAALKKTPKAWCPLAKRDAPWIDVRKLHKMYGKGGCAIA